ncbi:hypothetical protein [Massilia sp. PWRC2]|uniref:hypothetical protein n=1 Tax=Massilia sp. PWRC2 TaxID=2804626 RepID=UPI003CF83A45
MATTKRVGGSDNILARLDRSGNGARARWPHAARAAWTGTALAALGLAAALLLSMRPERAQSQRGAPLMVATPISDAAPAASAPAPAEPSLEAQAAAQVEAQVQAEVEAALAPRPEVAPAAALAAVDPQREAASLEPIPVLPMLADVVEQAPAAPAPHVAARTTRTRPAPVAKGMQAATARAAERPGTPPPPPVNGQDAANDTDVALLSAILLHAPRHSAERAKAEAKCRVDKNCTWSGPLPALLQAAH